ncbi:SDR family NAD(P)-dependent oxidoreductase [Acidiferrimicrobium sp. IK]|uniref:SDR family NAD(P)-dependent oxidoreductase n=1 Tax=Acidiferrimicrobium sp. IK TaxID=2871700 RepID=UPI0021CB3087|nr:SDR family NAD(P)-dependent oxidoreductase [Acidiferrimicrobium sp. IK]MCU4185892.1 SDR family NAD(P)-dependent oxidoreductase [Acidiferrimicrobium sp. IK]
MKRGPILLLGGRSEIGLAVVERLVRADPRPVVLAARAERHGAVSSGAVPAPGRAAAGAALRAAGAPTVSQVDFDADDLASHAGILDAVIAEYGPIGTAVVAFGILGDQARAERDVDHALAIVHTDYVAQVSMLTLLAERGRTAGAGQIVAFSSIAGARVRRANYVYGSAKAGLDGFATGLSSALAGSGVSLLLVRPGFVTGRMTAGMPPAPLARTPEQVADATVRALAAGRREVWVPATLGPLAAVAHLVPSTLWRRLPR